MKPGSQPTPTSLYGYRPLSFSAAKCSKAKPDWSRPMSVNWKTVSLQPTVKRRKTTEILIKTETGRSPHDIKGYKVAVEFKSNASSSLRKEEKTLLSKRN